METGEGDAQWICQKPVKAAEALGMFSSSESLNNARIERMTPPIDCSEKEEAFGRVIRSIRALFNASGGRNLLRVLAALTGLWPTVRRAAPLQQRLIRVVIDVQIGLCCPHPSRDAGGFLRMSADRDRARLHAMYTLYARAFARHSGRKQGATRRVAARLPRPRSGSRSTANQNEQKSALLYLV